MADRPDAYFRKNPGDVIRSSEWNELQVKAREEIRAHRHSGNEDGSLIPRTGIEGGAIDGKLIDPAAEVSLKTLTTSGNLTVSGDLKVNGKALLGDIADLLATVKGLQDEKLNRRGDRVNGTLQVQKNLLVDGNVGIGTDNPSQQLTITGGLGFANQNAQDKKLFSPRDGLLEWMTNDSADVHGFAVSHQGEARFFLNTNGNSFLNGGNVGIGTKTPGQKLTVQGGHNSGRDPDSGLSYGGQLAIKGNACQLDFIDTDHDDWAILVNGSKMHFIKEPWTYTNLVLAANGYVGIGTDDPKAKLSVVGTAMISDGTSDVVAQGRMASGSLAIGSTATSYGGGSGWNDNTAGLMLATTANTEIAVHDAHTRLASLMYYEGNLNRITIGRDMGWGTTPLMVANSDLYFNGADHTYSGYGNGAGYAAIENAADYGALMILGRNVGTRSAVKRVVKLWDYLEVNGNLKVTGRISGGLEYLISDDNRWRLIMQSDRNLVVYGPSNEVVWHIGKNLSDLGLKDDVSPIKNALANLISLTGVSFSWKDKEMGTGRELGVIAQEVEPVFPELVSTLTGRKFVSYLGLIPVLIEAVKEQQAQIAELRNISG